MRAFALTKASMNLRQDTSRMQSSIALRTSVNFSLRSMVCIRAKNAVSYRMAEYTMYISMNKIMNGMFRRSTKEASTIVTTPKISIYGENSSYIRK